MKTLKILFSVVVMLLGTVATAQGQPLLKTHVETGDVEGVAEETILAVYKAIPYAAPPVGDLRWKGSPAGKVVARSKTLRQVRPLASSAHTSWPYG